jgi:hypothetical protein
MALMLWRVETDDDVGGGVDGHGKTMALTYGKLQM